MRRIVITVALIATVGFAVPQVGAATPAAIKVSPKEISFGTKPVGKTYFDSVRITNNTGKPMQVIVEGGLPDDFGFGLYPGSTCPALTPGSVMAAGESCKAVVRFTPSSGFIGWHATGSLVVTMTDLASGAVITAEIPVSGTAK